MPYWGIFPLLAMEMIVNLQICYSFHHSAERYCICFTGHYSCEFHQDELLVEHDVHGRDCPTIHDPVVDCFDEIMVVTLADYSLEVP